MSGAVCAPEIPALANVVAECGSAGRVRAPAPTWAILGDKLVDAMVSLASTPDPAAAYQLRA